MGPIIKTVSILSAIVGLVSFGWYIFDKWQEREEKIRRTDRLAQLARTESGIEYAGRVNTLNVLYEKFEKADNVKELRKLSEVWNDVYDYLENHYQELADCYEYDECIIIPESSACISLTGKFRVYRAITRLIQTDGYATNVKGGAVMVNWIGKDYNGFLTVTREHDAVIDVPRPINLLKLRNRCVAEEERVTLSDLSDA